MTAAEFERMTRQALAQINRLTDDSVRTAAAILRETQRDLVERLAGAPSDYNQWFYSALLDDARRMFDDLQRQYDREIGALLDAAADSVEGAVDIPVADATGMTLALPRLSRQTVELLTGYHPGSLIKGLTDDGYARVETLLRQGLLGIKTPYEVQQALIGHLNDSGVMGNLKYRAEVIWRTEAGRVFNVLATERYKRVAQDFPGRFLKRWLHSGNIGHPRPRHVALGGEPPIAADAQFSVNGYMVDGPHDPALPASEVIQCGCTSILELNPAWTG